ncbi:MAG TPA: mannose-6-phosphate isomerase, class I [Jatrophihabitantaceae bacterium]
MPDVFAIDGVIRWYEWGSRTEIQRMLGIEPDGRPAAELWFGAHEGDPSPARQSTLDRLIDAEPSRLLGAATVARFGPRLPFLIKVLAAETALSMQVHPTLDQARAGFAAGDPNYTDANHKPELLCALTPFEALCGFRPVAATLALLGELAIPELGFVADALRGPDGLRAAFTAVLTHPCSAVLADALAARARPDGPLRATWLAAHDFPGDVGVALSVLLNPVRLEPGEAIYLGAGTVHAYLRGTGVEIMANSDNVLRCGLTPKRIDVPELLKITDFAELAEPRWPADDGDAFTPPVPDFRLTSVRVDDYGSGQGGSFAVGLHGPHIVLCVAGEVEVWHGGSSVRLRPGHAAFVVARPAAFTVRGTGHVFLATTNI